MTTKELGKYEVLPTLEQLMSIVEFFEKHSTASGRVNFTQRQMFESPIISPHFNSPSYLNGVCTYLANEEFITKVEIGSRHAASIWDVTKLLKDWENVLTREDLGTSKPVRDENENLVVPENVEVEVVRKENQTSEEPKAIRVEEVNIVSSKEAVKKSNNNDILSQLQDAMSDMMGYLQNLPVEMGGHLRSISNQLELADEEALTKLQGEVSNWRGKYDELQNKYGLFQIKMENETNELKGQKKDLEEEVRSLKVQLEEAQSTPQYNVHGIYRRRNALMDEVDRMINAPAWSLKQNKVHYRNEIETLLDSIMEEVGIEKQ